MSLFTLFVCALALFQPVSVGLTFYRLPATREARVSWLVTLAMAILVALMVMWRVLAFLP